MQATIVLALHDNNTTAGLHEQSGADEMRFKRIRGPNKEQTRDDLDTIPMLREDANENLDVEVKKFFESIVLGDAESVEICYSEDQTSSSSGSVVATLNSQTLSSESNLVGLDIAESKEPKLKTVSFAEPMVSSSWDIPKIDAEEVKKLFYSSLDYKKFRDDRNGRDFDKFRDKEYCDRLVQNLDRMGVDSFTKGEYTKALEAFRHSLRVKTETFTEYDIRSTSATIHCIADVYSKLGKWNLALDTYMAAFDLLGRIKTLEEDDDARRWASTLMQKISTVQGYLDIVKSPSLDSI